MSEEYPELIHCWFSEKQAANQGTAGFTWFRMDDDTTKKVSETHMDNHGDASFFRRYDDAEYVGFGYFSHLGEADIKPPEVD